MRLTPRAPSAIVRLLALLAALALASAGCLRTRIDRCAEDPPHPDCLLLDGAVPPDGGDAGSGR